MISRVAADAVLVLHLVFILFVVAGGLLVVRHHKIMWFHLPAVVWGAFVEFSGRVCPLTPLEIELRAESGSAGYSGGFIEHYLLPVVYPAGLDRPAQVILGLGVVVINAFFYALIVRGWVRRSRDG